MAQPQCPACAGALPAGARFCPTCGAAQVQGGGASAPSAWVQFLDAAWDFFASTRVATVLIFLIAAAATIGSLVEQEGLYQDWRPPELYYPYRYGPFWGPLFMRLGFTHAYRSAWWVALLYLGVVSLVVCSLQRLVPLHRALRNPPVERHLGFVRRQPVTAVLPRGEGDPLAPLVAFLQRRGFRVLRRGRGLHADRGRLGRYGPYIIHIGLIVVAFAGAAKALPGWDVTVPIWVADGQTAAIPGTDLAVRNEKFTLEQHPDGSPRLFRTDAVLLDRGQEVARKAIVVNDPLVYRGWEIYQAAYNAEPGTVDLQVVEVDTGRVLGQVTFDLRDPAPSYALPGGYRARIEEYYPDFGIDEKTGQPVNKSRDILNPVFRITYLDAEGREVGAQALLVPVRPGQPPVPPIGRGPVQLQPAQVHMRWYTGLLVRRDRTVPYMAAGIGVVLAGMYITFFVFHRQIWALDTGDAVWIGARTNKNRWGLQQEMRRLAEALGGRLTSGLGVGAGTGGEPKTAAD